MSEVWEIWSVRSQLLLIGGRSGAGKTTAAIAFHERLKKAGVRHAVIEGDFLDLAWPAPHTAFPAAHLAERNLEAMWANYRGLGYRRLVFTNTVSILFVRELVAAMRDDPEVITVLLRASDQTVRARLGGRVLGEASAEELTHSAESGARLDSLRMESLHRIDTDDLAPADLAALLDDISGWTSDSATP